MKYMNAVAIEVLRLHPSVPKDVKFAVGDDTLPDGTSDGCGRLVRTPITLITLTTLKSHGTAPQARLFRLVRL